jgi:regulatory protein
MGREVQGEDSSSPSDNLKLVQTYRTGTAGERVKLEFSDGSCFFVSDSDLQELGLFASELTPGIELSEASIQRLKHASTVRQVREKALDLLARAPHTTFALRVKLLKRRFDTRAVEEVLDALGHEGYLDDADFAENWLRNRIEHHPEGRAVLIAGLLRKGASREIAESVVNRFLAPETEMENARRALEKLTRSGETDPAKLKRKLRTRGFAFPMIRRLLDGLE